LIAKRIFQKSTLLEKNIFHSIFSSKGFELSFFYFNFKKYAFLQKYTFLEKSVLQSKSVKSLSTTLSLLPSGGLVSFPCGSEIYAF